MTKVKVGMRVRITPSSCYRNAFQGSLGTIVRCRDDLNSVGIKIDGVKNSRSSYDCFWFSKRDIKNIESENESMMFEKFRVASVRFMDGTNMSKDYYYALYDEVDINDLVVVKTGHHGLAVAKVHALDEVDVSRVTDGREIICRVNTSAYNERVHKRDALAKLKKNMDKKVKELQETAIYELLAKEDDALAKMLAEYKALLD